ncbi:hypothetical protein ADUPG1_001160, partial [Aduncisulcus paluster]
GQRRRDGSATVLTRDGYYRLHPVQSLLAAPLLHPIHPRPVYLSRPSTQYLDFTAASSKDDTAHRTSSFPSSSSSSSTSWSGHTAWKEIREWIHH